LRLGRSHLALRFYRCGTGIGGRSDDRDEPIAAGEGFAAAARDRVRGVLSRDSR